MSPAEFMIRLIVSLAVFVFGVLIWALGPFLSGAHIPGSGVILHAPIMSIFFGTADPIGFTVIALLLARGFFAMVLVSWILVPAAGYFLDADCSPLARAGVIVFMSASVAAFMASLLVHIFYYGGGTLFS